jgi:hypothetical protein
MQFYKNSLKPVLWILEILVRIRIRGSYEFVSRGGLKFLKYTSSYRYLLELTAFVLQRGEAKAETAEEDGTHRRGGDCLQVISKA